MTGNKEESKRMGATLSFIRKERGVSQTELAKALDISQAFLANIEAGRRSLTPHIAKQACKVLGVRPIVLVNENFLKSALAHTEKNNRPTDTWAVDEKEKSR